MRLVDTVRRVGRPKVRPEDKERGDRFARLREARGFETQAALLKDVATRVQRGELTEENGLDRVEYQRVESGDNRFTSKEFQSKLAAIFEVDRARLTSYADGELELDACVSPMRSMTSACRVRYSRARRCTRAPITRRAARKQARGATIAAPIASAIRSSQIGSSVRPVRQKCQCPSSCPITSGSRSSGRPTRV